METRRRLWRRWSGLVVMAVSVCAVVGARVDQRQPVVRVVYAVPSDRRAIPGLSSAIRHELTEVAAWFVSQTGGSSPRFASSSLRRPVPVVRLPESTSDLRNAGRKASGLIVPGLRSRIGARRNDVLLAYVDGEGGPQCGEGDDETKSAVLWMLRCERYPEAHSRFPEGATYLAAHELVHTLGGAPPCAPNNVEGHVNDDRADLIYDGPGDRDWDHLTLDVHHDDYYGTTNPRCPSISDHPVWRRSP